MSTSLHHHQQSHDSRTLEQFRLPSLRVVVVMIIVFVVSIVGVCVLLTRLHYTDLQDFAKQNLRSLILVQDEFNQKLLADLDGKIQLISTELQNVEINADNLFHQYNALINENSILQSMLIADADGLVIFDSRVEQPSTGKIIADQTFFSVHITQNLDGLYIGDPKQQEDGNDWSVPISKVIRDNNGDLSHVAVIWASSRVWSESLEDLGAPTHYSGYLARDDGIVLTTFPFNDALISTQLPDNQRPIFADNVPDSNRVPSFADNQFNFIDAKQLDNAPIILVLEIVNTAMLFQADRVVVITTLIAIAVIASGGSFLYTYIGSYKALALQTANLNQMNIQLKDDVLARSTVESDLRHSEELYRNVTELISDYAFSIIVNDDKTFNLDWITSSFYTITGYDDVDIFADNRTHPDDRERVRKNFEHTLLGHDSIIEYRYQIKSSDYIWLRIKSHPIWDEDKKRVVQIVGAGSNINAEKEAELALRDSEERYRIVSEMMSGYAYSSLVDENGEISREWLTDSFYTMSGYDKEAGYLEFAADRRAHPDYVDMLANDMARTLQGEQTVSEYRWRVKSGNYIWLRVKRRPIWDEDHKKVVRFIAAGTDITIEKEAELAVRKNEQLYREISELMSDYAFSVKFDQHGDIEQIEWVVGSVYESVGITAYEMMNNPNSIAELHHPDDKQMLNEDFSRTFEGHKTATEYRIIHALTQQVRWLRVTRQPLWDKNHTYVARILTGVTDITAQKEAELALRDSEERYRMLTEILADYAFLVRIEEDGRLFQEWMVGDFERIMGFAVPQTGYYDTDNFQKLYMDSSELVQSHVKQTLQGETTVSEYQVINHTTDEPRWVRITRQPIWNQDRTKVSHYLAAVIDITLQKESEIISREADKLRQALDHEKSLHELRSRFVSMVTHEFRNPLAAIQSSASILQQYADRISESSREEKFNRIYSQINRLTKLLEDLLKVGELEHQILQFLPERIDIIAIINDLYTEYRESIGREHNLLLESEQDKIIIWGDAYLLQQALSNIISNAIKYSPIESDVICQVNKLEEEKIMIRVIDHGLGIPEKDYDELFKAFYRASNVATQPGTGLGLLIAQQSIELHRGTIDFTSKVGEGTIFTITLPQGRTKDNNLQPKMLE